MFDNKGGNVEIHLLLYDYPKKRKYNSRVQFVRYVTCYLRYVAYKKQEKHGYIPEHFL